MNKGQRYFAEEGHRSKSGKTIVRISKGGRKYYHNPTQYREKKEEKLKELGITESVGRHEYPNQRLKSICYDEKSDAYMRYFEKKVKIRNEYPKWVFMSRDQHREYFSKIWDLLVNDSDWNEWLRVDSKTAEEKRNDEWWEERKRKDDEYNGRWDEY